MIHICVWPFKLGLLFPQQVHGELHWLGYYETWQNIPKHTTTIMVWWSSAGQWSILAQCRAVVPNISSTMETFKDLHLYNQICAMEMNHYLSANYRSSLLLHHRSTLTMCPLAWLSSVLYVHRGSCSLKNSTFSLYPTIVLIKMWKHVQTTNSSKCFLCFLCIIINGGMILNVSAPLQYLPSIWPFGTGHSLVSLVYPEGKCVHKVVIQKSYLLSTG